MSKFLLISKYIGMKQEIKGGVHTEQEAKDWVVKHRKETDIPLKLAFYYEEVGDDVMLCNAIGEIVF